jgi:hypothetical protein
MRSQMRAEDVTCPSDAGDDGVRSVPAAVEGGRIDVGTQDGKLICIDTGDKALMGWPCWGGNPQHTGVGEAKK